MVDKKVIIILVLLAVNAVTWLLEPQTKTLANSLVYSLITISLTLFALKHLAGKRDAGL